VTRPVPAFEAIADALVAAGVTEVFGLMGDDTAKLATAVVGRGLSYRDARHENAAVAMAVGYSSITGRVGVCILNRGPGLTNGLTAIVNAGKGGARLLVLSGADPVGARSGGVAAPDGKSYDSEGFAGDLYRQFTPRRADDLASCFRRAFASAGSGRPAGLHVPKNLLEAPVEPGPDWDVGEPAAAPGAPPAEAVDAAWMALEAAERPLIIAGAGAWAAGAKAAIETLAARTGAVLATTLKAKDLFRGNPLDLGLIGTFSHSTARRHIERCDCVVAFGAGLNQYTTSKGEALPHAPLVQVDVRPEHLGRYHPVDVGVAGDARDVAEALLARVADRRSRVDDGDLAEVRAQLADFDPRRDFEPAGTRWTIDPREVVLLLDELLPADRAVVTDTGNFFGHVPPHIHVPAPDHFKQSSDYSAIGLGLGTALGVASGRPSAVTALFVGDGSCLMALGELETLARLALPLVVVVMNDCAYGAERHYLELQGVSGAKCVYPDTDFAAVAESLGVEGATVRSEEQLRALAPRLASPDGPLVIDCKVTPTVVAPFISEALAAVPATTT
jgi:acetolactate synthase I/II/III large subunit